MSARYMDPELRDEFLAAIATAVTAVIQRRRIPRDEADVFFGSIAFHLCKAVIRECLQEEEPTENRRHNELALRRAVQELLAEIDAHTGALRPFTFTPPTEESTE